MSTSTATTETNQQGTVRLATEVEIESAANDAQFQSVARGTRDGRLKLGGIPKFSDPLEKRKWMKEHMAAAFRYFGKLGYGEGISGHISIRGTHKQSVVKCPHLTPPRPYLEGPFLDESLRQAFLVYKGF